MPDTETSPETCAPQLQFRLPLEPARLLRARERMRDYLQSCCSEQELIDGIILCIEEACTNAIRHSGSQDEMEVALRFESSDLLVEVVDRGLGFDLDGFDPDTVPDPLATGGRGLFLMTRLMDDLTVQRDHGFRVSMVKRGILRNDPQALDSGLGELGSQDRATRRETRLRALLEELDEAFFALDWQYRYVHANQAALKMMDKSAGELLGRTPGEVFPGLEVTPLMAALKEAMELGRPAVVEQRSVVNGDWLEVRVYPTPVGVSVYYRQINERKHIEEELSSSRARLAAILGTLSDAFYTLDRRWRVTFANDRAADYFGRPREMLLGHDVRKLLPQAISGAFAEGKHRAMAGEAASTEAYYAPLGIWLEERDYPSPEGVTVLLTDVTARKQADFERQEASEELLTQGEEMRSQGEELNSQALKVEATNEALRSSQRDYQLLFAAMSSGFAVHEIVTDTQGHPVDYRFLEVNEAFEELTGLRAGKIVGRTALEVLPGLEPSWIETYGAVALGGGPARFESYSTPLERHYEVIAYSPSPGRFATIFNDISERMRVEHERHKQAAELYARSLIEASPDPLVTISQDGSITDVNEATEKVTGAPRSELIGTDFSDYFTDPEQARAGYRKVFSEGLVRDYPLSIRHRNGTITDVLYNASLYRDEAGEVAGVFAAARDVTETKKAEAQVAQLAAIVESSGDAIIGKDLQGRIVSWNSGAERMYGYRFDEVQGKSVAILAPADHADDLDAILKRIRLGERVKNLETVRITKRGKRVDVSRPSRRSKTRRASWSVPRPSLATSRR